MTAQEWQRYERHLALPEITPAHQKRLKQARILMVGAGGLGAAALPYLAGAGIGHITVMDHDTVDVTNLHRQTIYKTSEVGQSKVTFAADYIKSLNPHCDVRAIERRFGDNEIQNEEFSGFDIILDGSDNFATKILLNRAAISAKIPYVTASISRFETMVALLAGHLQDAPCYNCLFPDTPKNACNCNESGVLGTVPGLAGLYQAHLTLCYLLGIGEAKIGTILSLQFDTFRLKKLQLEKDPSCPTCSGQIYNDARTHSNFSKIQNEEIALLGRDDLNPDQTLIIDVREPYEVAADPVRGAVNIPLATLPHRLSELPHDKTLALVCAANVRSRMGAQILRECGFNDVCILDKARAA